LADYIQISFSELQPEQKDILIAQLSDAGFEGFEESENTLDAFIKETDFDKSVLDELLYKYKLHFNQLKIASTNWNQVWESNFQPVIVNNFVAIRAGFHEPIAGVEFEIIITPKMSFGTGHHATTYMMIEQMRKIDFTGKSVFDFGTGTGILAILAEKLGAKEILAVDNDDWSIDNANENTLNNNCKKVVVRKDSNITAGKKFDIILANINKNVILDKLPTLYEYLDPKGTLILSGLLAEDREAILYAVTVYKLQLQKELIRDNWICLSICL